MPKGVYDTQLTPSARTTLARRKAGRDMKAIVAMAREHTTWALKRMIKIAEGDAGKVRVLVPGTSEVVEVDVEVPASVQQRALEFIIERGWGKAPQAILIEDNSAAQKFGVNAIPIMERIEALREARTLQGATTDLEASEQQEIEDTPEAELVTTTSDNPQDMI